MDTGNENVSILMSPKATATAPVTPRRSARKSVMPRLDYDDIIEKKMSRSEAKKTRASELVTNASSPQHKWMPSEVGRVSQSRRRKSKRIMAKSNGAEPQELTAREECETYSKDLCIEEEQNEKENIALQDKRVERSSKGHIVGETEPTKDVNNLEKNGLTVDLQSNENESFGVYLKSKAMDISDLGLEPLQTEENNDEMPSLLLCDDEEDTTKSYAGFGKSEGTSTGQIAALKNSFTEDVQHETDDEKNDVIPSILIDDSEEGTEKSNSGFGKSEGTSTGHIVALNSSCTDHETYDEENDVMPSILIVESEEGIEKSNVISPKTEALSAEEEQENKNEVLNSTFDTEESTVLIEHRDTKSLSNEKERQKDHTQNDESISTINEEIVMQSLQISDDEDANDEKLVEQCHISDGLNSKINEQPIVKFVLTDDTQQRTTLFHCNLPQPRTPKATRVKPYRQPTPYKATLPDNVEERTQKFEEIMSRSQTGLNLTTLEPRDIALRSIRKRSNSFSINPQAARGVTFYSPANQILGIEDVDKLMAKSAKKQAMSRKDTLVDINVTKRRKRSISLDERKFKVSRIPKPMVVSMAPLAKINTTLQKGVSPASKQKCRTKLPNFAAIHQKHFNEMENLVQHLERKAERAKVLTNSVTKARQASAQKNKSVKPTASKTPNKKLELLFQEKPTTHLPKPRQILDKQTLDTKYSQTKVKQQPMKEPNAVAPAASRPAFTLSTQVTSSVLGSNTTRYADKISERRQRHIDMYKGRMASKRGDPQRNEIIRGVRSNRRFQLQMQHRKNLEEQ